MQQDKQELNDVLPFPQESSRQPDYFTALSQLALLIDAAEAHESEYPQSSGFILGVN